MRIVLDTNVLISAMLNGCSVPGRVVNLLLDEHRLVVSQRIIDEWNDVVGRRKFDRWATMAERLELVRLLLGVADLVLIISPIVACRDPKDDKYLDAAVGGTADAIVSGDADLLSLHPFQGIPILSPKAFLAAFAAPLS